MNRPEHLVFDSGTVPPSERFARYCEINGAAVQALQTGPSFAARLMRWRLGRAVLHERYLNDVMHERDAARARADGACHFVLHLVLSGQYEVDSGSGFVLVDTGQIVLVDMAQPMRSRAQMAQIVTVSIQRHMIVQAIGDTDTLHGVRLGGSAAGVLADFANMLARRAQDLTVAAIPGVTRALVMLLSAAIADTERVEIGERDDVDAARLDRVQSIIEQSLGDPRFGPEVIVATAGLSRATLYRLFKSKGGLRAYIQQRRLDRVRVSLSADEQFRSLAEIAVAAGFRSEGHCSRQFLSAFGMRPSDYRAEVAAAGVSGKEPRLGYWLDGLR